MKLAWVTHHLPRETDSTHPAHLPGKYVGGAEMTDATLRDMAPEGVEVVLIHPDRYLDAFDCDKILITGTDFLDDKAMWELSACEPTLFLHHLQPRSPERKQLIESARLVILHTPAHLEKEREWCNPKEVELILSPLDVDECYVLEPKINRAVWANRMHDLKGPRAAAMWAARQDMELLQLSNVPREEVLKAMAESKYFIHLPIGFESESRATMEAVLSGCKVIANKNVGVTSVDGWDDPDALSEMLTSAGAKWWRAVL